jgi:hypothetical protein
MNTYQTTNTVAGSTQEVMKVRDRLLRVSSNELTALSIFNGPIDFTKMALFNVPLRKYHQF